jgi:Right handed beta helix region/Dockerin type I domain
MRDIHRSTTTWLARRTGRGSTARPLHRSHRRRLTLEPLEGRALLSLTTWTVNSLGDTGTGSGTSGDLRYVITQADQTTGDNTINFAVTGTITLYSALPDLSNTTGLMDIEGPSASSLTVARSSAAGTLFFGVFTVDSSVTASLTGLTISGGASGFGGVGGGIDNVGTLTVTDSTIDNNGADLGGGGIFNSGTLTVTNSTIDNNFTATNGGGIDSTGTLTVTNCTISNNSPENNEGGGIYVAGMATVTNSTIAGNSADDGGGIYVAGTATVTNSTIDNNSTENNEGGGIYVAGMATVTNSTIDNNGGANEGGGIYVAGMATVTNSTIDNNSTENNIGGGIYVAGMATVTDSTIDNNSAEDGGGGIYNSGTLALTNSTIGNNHTFLRGPGGGGIINFGTLTVTNSSIIDNGSGGQGGGIFNTGTVTDTNSTIADNSAEFGGGIDNLGMLTVTNSTIANNTASVGGGGLVDFGSSLLDNTLIALNTSGTGTPDDIAGTVSSASAYNLIGIGGSGGLVNGTNGNQVGVADPGLDPNGLQNNGGPTQTIALVTGSPAIDAGSIALAVDPTTGQPLTTDQRGFPRIVNGTVDIGAYEVQSYITAVAVGWGTQTAALQTAADGLRLLPAGRNTDLPWLGIDRVQITLTQPATLAAGDISVIGSSGTNYGPVTVTGSGTSYTITLAQPINAADRVTITIGNDLIAPFNRRLDVLPGDVNDDGVVNVQDMVAIRNQMLGLLGAVPTIFGDILGDGTVDINDYTAVRELIGTTLPSIT